MDLPEYLEFVAKRLRTSDKNEVLRLIDLLIETLIETRDKINHEKK